MKKPMMSPDNRYNRIKWANIHSRTSQFQDVLQEFKVYPPIRRPAVQPSKASQNKRTEERNKNKSKENQDKEEDQGENQQR